MPEICTPYLVWRKLTIQINEVVLQALSFVPLGPGIWKGNQVARKRPVCSPPIGKRLTIHGLDDKVKTEDFSTAAQVWAG